MLPCARVLCLLAPCCPCSGGLQRPAALFFLGGGAFFCACIFLGTGFGGQVLGLPPTSRSVLVRLRCDTLEFLVLPCWLRITHSTALRAMPEVGRPPSGFLTSAPTQPLVIEPGSPHGNLPLSSPKHRPHQHSAVSKTRNGHPLA